MRDLAGVVLAGVAAADRLVRGLQASELDEAQVEGDDDRGRYQPHHHEGHLRDAGEGEEDDLAGPLRHAGEGTVDRGLDVGDPLRVLDHRCREGSVGKHGDHSPRHVVPRSTTSGDLDQNVTSVTEHQDRPPSLSTLGARAPRSTAAGLGQCPP
ncbi:hypothetical protein [Ornithinimicrobium kibberense]|uniref:hypothetical protein n=1 Tax=Ornithinimicrobium kibberense TaxID=282060 RepID=UPI00361D2FCA